MRLLSCANCWYNAVQYGDIGLQYGYCIEHHKVLLDSTDTTCGRMRRKDLGLPSADQQAAIHGARYPKDQIVYIREPSTPATRVISESEHERAALERDQIAKTVLEYASYEQGTRIASIAQLRAGPARSEVAMLSLSRGYLQTCYIRSRRWMSGLHIYAWVRETLAMPPAVNATDLLRASTSVQRQLELIEWSIIMLRLSLITDIAHYAQRTDDHPVGELVDLLDEAALHSGRIKPGELLRWIKDGRDGAVRRLDRAMPRQEYERLRASLHQERA